MRYANQIMYLCIFMYMGNFIASSKQTGHEKVKLKASHYSAMFYVLRTFSAEQSMNDSVKIT